VIGAPQQLPVLLQEALLLARREVALDPGLADQRLGRLVLVEIEQRLGVADMPARGQRRTVGEQAPDQRMIRRIGDRVLGDRLQLLGPGPMRIVDQKSGDRREIRRLTVLDHAQPAHGLGRERIVDQRRQPRRALPFVASGRLKGLPGDRPLLGTESVRGRTRSQPQPHQTGADPQPTQQQSHPGSQRQHPASVRMFIDRPCSRSVNAAPAPFWRSAGGVCARRRVVLCLPHPSPALMVRQPLTRR
jgi:hypothetical protein